MNAHHGGAQPVPRDTIVPAVGEYSTIYEYENEHNETVKVDAGLKVGATQSFLHTDRDPPPFYSQKKKRTRAPVYDVGNPMAKRGWGRAPVTRDDSAMNAQTAGTEHEILAAENANGVDEALAISIAGTSAPEREFELRSDNAKIIAALQNDAPPTATALPGEIGGNQVEAEVIDAPKGITPPHAGKPIGLATALFQRGLWHPDGMVLRLTSKNVQHYRTCACEGDAILPCCRAREMVHVMAEQPDFAAQQSALEELVHAQGHRVIFSVKCHPEMAGNGIEYAWGMAKLQFRRRFNDLSTQRQAENVSKSLSTESVVDKDGVLRSAPLCLERVRKYSRRARTYRYLYEKYGEKLQELADERGVTGYDLLENMRKKVSTHRNICELEVEYLNDDLISEEKDGGESCGGEEWEEEGEDEDEEVDEDDP
mmetsp:Transcript_17808/g.47436  ORF Transcript_17808/g.47436 Transcript_17808/m.47436 type:complete len:426 (-) Transcript_17808:240-1517(-)